MSMRPVLVRRWRSDWLGLRGFRLGIRNSLLCVSRELQIPEGAGYYPPGFGPLVVCIALHVDRARRGVAVTAPRR